MNRNMGTLLLFTKNMIPCIHPYLRKNGNANARKRAENKLFT